MKRIRTTFFALIPFFPFAVLFVALLVAVYHIRVYW